MNRIDYIAKYNGCDCIVHETNNEVIPTVAYIEGVDFNAGHIICERVNYEPSQIQLLLRPMSDLKNLSLNENNIPYLYELYSKFNKQNCLLKHGNFQNRVDSLKFNHPNHLNNFITENTDNVLSMPYILVEILIEMRFDIFGLIEKGYAIIDPKSNKVTDSNINVINVVTQFNNTLNRNFYD